MVIKRGDMFYADLSPVVGSEQGGIRPVIIIQNDIGNKNSGLKADSIVLTEQIRTIDKSRLKEKIGHINEGIVMDKINNALGVSFGLD